MPPPPSSRVGVDPGLAPVRRDRARGLLALTVLIFLVLALTSAPALAYVCWLGVYALAAVTETGWRRRPGPRPRREPPPGPAADADETREQSL